MFLVFYSCFRHFTHICHVQHYSQSVHYWKKAAALLINMHMHMQPHAVCSKLAAREIYTVKHLLKQITLSTRYALFSASNMR